jgi:hypothetical protein
MHARTHARTHTHTQYTHTHTYNRCQAHLIFQGGNFPIVLAQPGFQVRYPPLFAPACPAVIPVPEHRGRGGGRGGGAVVIALVDLVVVIGPRGDWSRVPPVPRVMPTPVLNIPHALGGEPDHVDLLRAAVVHLRRRASSSHPAATAPAAGRRPSRRWAARLRCLHLCTQHAA